MSNVTTLNTDSAPSATVTATYARLLPLCVSGLQAAANRQTGLFDLQIRGGKAAQPTLATENVTSTLICLIGLDRAGIAAEDLGLPSERALAAAFDSLLRQQAHGATGLAIWANAVLDGVAVHELFQRIDLSLDDGAEFAERLTTMEVAWLASGLLHEMERGYSHRLACITRSVVTALCSRFGERACLVSHSGATGPLQDRLRRRLPNFADQIYTVQALALAAIVLQDERALLLSERIAGRLIELQGRLGQWWWHYDASTGQVAEGYPVYSVHQHAMAPMALMTLRAAGGSDHAAAIARSHSWLERNELDLDVVDPQTPAIWRDIERSEPPVVSLGSKMLELAGHRRDSEAPAAALRLNREIRPYEWGWCLYAGSLAEGKDRGRHIV
ncbi:hypothetical protein C7U60_02360 [Mesorhizobium plurifarium]|uniref:hypothetical protein n=1 Tax=Sinorhizobium arboris TaxID=76745 RepID=UPI00040C8494|nr:hypothetical protein [Sinorhizobium arboris]PST27150.1 hypothetical protein C7U60_02360 [Mesorhizobium plurifarium]